MYFAFTFKAEKEVPDYLTGLHVHEHFAHGFGWKELPDNYKALFSELWHPEAYTSGIIRQAGWLFDLREFFKEYWVEDEVCGIRKIYAPCRGFIRQMSSYPHHILRIVEIKKKPRKKVSA